MKNMMTTGIMLVLMGLASFQIIGDNVMENIEVTPRIEIVEIPSEFSVFRQVGCDKYVNVFGVHIFASPTTPEDKLSHAAGVLAQYLDNDEDGTPNNTLVLSHLVSRNVFIIMPGTQAEMETLEMELVEEAGYRFGQDLYGEETKPDFLVDGKINAPDGGYYDGALEEILHPITQHGYANAYPRCLERDGDRSSRSAWMPLVVDISSKCHKMVPRAGIPQKLGITIRMRPVTMVAWLQSISTGL